MSIFTVEISIDLIRIIMYNIIIMGGIYMQILKNTNTELIYDEIKGCMTSLKYENKEYIGAEIPVFELAFRDENGNLKTSDTYDFSCICENVNDSGLELTYKNKETEVIISVRLDEKLVWGIDVKGINDKTLEWVKYPQIAVVDDFLNDEGNGCSKALWGFNEGTLIESMDDREKGIPYFEPEYPCKGIMGVFPAIVETQFLEYFDDRSGLYIASHDSQNYLKGINIYRKNGGVLLEFRHFTGCDFGENYKMPYPMVIEFFKGDWQDGAEIYKKWFRQNKTSDFIKIEKNKKIPKWYSESPVIVIYPVRGKHDTDIMKPNNLFPYVNVMPHVERLEKLFGSKIMILLMHWEGTAPWAPPIVWPPYGGEEEFKKLVKALHERGDVIGVYCSGLGWTINSKLDDYKTHEFFEENNLKDEMCLSPKQDLPYSDICTLQRDGYDMCPTRDFTKKIVKSQVEHMVKAGIDYIQLMDQNHGGTSYFCYSKKHDHPPVPGKWQVDAVKKLLSSINEITGDVLLGCESAAAESYIPNLLFSDNRFNLAYYIGHPVPAYAYIFHEYLNNFLGNQVCVDWHIDYNKSPESFFERIGYSFSAGDMLTVVITENGEIDWNWGKLDRDKTPPNQEYAGRLIKNLNYWRTNQGKKYLHTGSMIKPLPVECEKLEIWRNNGSKCEIPRIHTSAWEAQDGKTAQFLINYLGTENIAIIDFSDNVYIMSFHDGREKITLTGKCEIKIDAFSAVMLEKL